MFWNNFLTISKQIFYNFLGKCDQIRFFLRIWSNLLKKSLREKFIFSAVILLRNSSKKILGSLQLYENKLV